MRKTFATLLLALAFAGGLAVPAVAHKVVAGAYASGNTIEGEIGFSDGSMAKDVLVEVTAEDGTKLGETRTKDDGTFVFTPTQRVTHVFHADLGGGHVADFRVEASDLPGSLAAAGATGAAVAPTGAKEAAAQPSTAGAAATSVTDAQKAALAEAVRNEVRPLRREIIALKEKNDLQSIIGGIGYIAGLFGLWFFLAARRKTSKAG